MSFWPTVKKAIREADVILLILDARMPVLSLNREVIEKIRMNRKEKFLVFNKIDLISEKDLNSLRKENQGAFFVSGAKKTGIKNMKRSLIEYADKYAITTLKIGVVGYPNVGKSSIINAISKRGSAPVSSAAGTTKGIQWIKTDRLKFLDSPGVIPFEDKSSKLGLLGAKNHEKLKNTYNTAYKLLEMYIKKDKSALEKYYNMKFSDDVEEIFNSIGKRKGFLSKGGIVDETKTAISILRDWQKGKIRI